MQDTMISGGTAHKLPADLQSALMANKGALVKWQSLTPLARNEWICWNISVKQEQTRKDHIKRTIEELLRGKRRPCCWIGCIHRTDKKLSPSVRGILNRQISKNNNKAL